MKTQWTHLTLHVDSLKTSIAFCARYTSLRVVERHLDASSTGIEAARLRDRSKNDVLSFVNQTSPDILIPVVGDLCRRFTECSAPH